MPASVALICLALTVYHEGRGEPLRGQYAIAHVVMNRVKDGRWGASVCSVVAQKKQFSYTKNHSFPKNVDALQEAVRVSQHVINGRPDSTQGSTHYFNPSLAVPSWAGELQYVMRIGSHDFYK